MRKKELMIPMNYPTLESFFSLFRSKLFSLSGFLPLPFSPIEIFTPHLSLRLRSKIADILSSPTTCQRGSRHTKCSEWNKQVIWRLGPEDEFFLVFFESRFSIVRKKKSYDDPKQERLIPLLLTLRKKAIKILVVCGVCVFFPSHTGSPAHNIPGA